MAVIGFILSFLIMLYFTFALFAYPYISGLGGGMKKSDVALWLVFACVIGYAWYWVFLNAPFTLTLN